MPARKVYDIRLDEHELQLVHLACSHLSNHMDVVLNLLSPMNVTSSRTAHRKRVIKQDLTNIQNKIEDVL